METKPKEN